MAQARSPHHAYLKVCLSPDIMTRLHWFVRFHAAPGQTQTDVVRGAIATCLAPGSDFELPRRRMGKRDETGGVKRPEFDVYISKRQKDKIAEIANECNVFQSFIVECMLDHVYLRGIVAHGAEGGQAERVQSVNPGIRHAENISANRA